MKTKTFTGIDGYSFEVSENIIDGLYFGEDDDYYVGVKDSKNGGVDLIQITRDSFMRNRENSRR